MPVVRRGGGNDVDIFVLKQLPHVGISLQMMAFISEPSGGAFQDSRIAITKRRQTHAFHGAKGLDVAGPAPSKSNDSHTDVVIGARGLRPEAGRQAEAAGCQEAGFKKAA